MKYLQSHWKPLLVRGLIFVAGLFAIGYFAGWDLRTAWPAILIASAVLSIAWTFVA
ncbi:hypothetical protein KKHFBJBL_02742 [Brevundimonas sp. NIBR11]|nr:hypothetical protein KKHFBJBL_02742 [Brevundimonas sp. NIBR11]